MPALKHDTNADRRSWYAIGAGLVFMGLGMFLWAALGWALAGFLCAFVGGGGGVIGFFVFMHRYRCPQCGARLPYRGGPTPGEKALYHCRHCDVTWDTGLMEGGEADSVTPSRGPAPPEVLARIHELLFAANRVEAIKLWRGSCGGRLSEAVFRINEIEDDLRAVSPEKFMHPDRRR
jgi:hypothetical protein